MSNRKPEVWRSTVLGDETTPPIKVKCLPPAELHVFQRISDLQKIIDAAESAKKEINQLRKACKHHYFDDTAGFPYDTRHCVVCGTHMGVL